MGLPIELAYFIVGLLIFFMYVAYAHKNAYFALAASTLGFLFASTIWIGGITQQTGSTITGTIGTVANFTQTNSYTPINLGFSQNYLAMFFVLLALMMFFQAIMAFMSPEGSK
jgi:hypothetical protein